MTAPRTLPIPPVPRRFCWCDAVAEAEVPTIGGAAVYVCAEHRALLDHPPELVPCTIDETGTLATTRLAIDEAGAC